MREQKANNIYINSSIHVNTHIQEHIIPTINKHNCYGINPR